MANLNGFNAAEVEPNTGFDPLPAGEYEVCISESEMKDNKAGTGQYLKLTFQVLSGPFINRKLWKQLNLVHPNSQAVDIARGELSAICRAVDVLTPNDSSQLHNIPMKVKVVCKKREDTGDIQNEIRKYEPLGGSKAEPAKVAAPAADVLGERATDGNKMAWMNK